MDSKKCDSNRFMILMPIHDEEKKREYDRIWVHNKRHGLPTRTTTPLTPTERKERMRLRRTQKINDIREKRNQILNILIGTKCRICNANRKLHLHQKNGKSHGKNSIMQLSEADFDRMVIKHPDEWVRLCNGCHQYVHWCLKQLNMQWAEIESRLKSH